MSAKKNFILDTNVILHDYKCIYNFQENDIYIPIVVLEELDKFKKGNEEINYNARQFTRELDEISDNDFFEKGAEIGEGLGKLFIVVNREPSEALKAAFMSLLASLVKEIIRKLILWLRSADKSGCKEFPVSLWRKRFRQWRGSALPPSCPENIVEPGFCG